MVQRIELATPHQETYANPAPLGLLGLAVGCAALTPIAFGYCLTPSGFMTAAVFVLLFGSGCQFLTGMMELRNGNGFGGVIFTLFAFLWAVNAWELYLYAGAGAAAAAGGASPAVMPDHGVKLVIDVVMLMILLPLTFGFGFFSKSLFWLLVDIDLLFACKIVRGVTHTQALNIPIAVLTVILGLLGIWIALATLINPVAGRQVFRIAGPLFFAPKQPTFDWTRRRRIFDALYAHWRKHAFQELSLAELRRRFQDEDLLPDVEYLQEFGYLAVLRDDEDQIMGVRLTAQGIDLHEQLVLRKYEL